MIEHLVRDIWFGLQQCRRNPGFTVAAVMSLALGIGANAALFSFVDAILLKQLPVSRVEDLTVLKRAGGPVVLSYTQLNELNRQASDIDGLMGTHPLDVSLMVGDEPQWVSAELVTAGYFDVLGVKPERGQLLTQRNIDAADGDATCVISYRLWQNMFQGGEDVVGRTVRLNARPYRIIGISQRGFTGTDLQRPADLEIPATRLVDYMPAFVGMPKFDWKSRLSLFSAMARMKPGASRSGAEQQLTRLNSEYLKTQQRGEDKAAVELADGRAGLQGWSKLARPALILLAVSLVVLLIACANLATLLLSRTSARTSEFALRLAIGGSRGRVLGQVLVESALLAAFGTIAGVGVAYTIQRVLLLFLNRTVPQIHQLQIGIDGRDLGFVALTAGICVLLFGAGPAIQAARTAALGTSAGNTGAGVKMRKAFVVAQIALSFTVVLSAGLLGGTLRNLTTVDLGFRPDEITGIDIRPAAGGYTGKRVDEYYTRVLEQVRRTPGVEAAATAFGMNVGDGFKMKLDNAGEVNLAGVGAGYFKTFGARLVEGREFDERDSGSTQQVYIISEHLAKSYFHGESAVGQSLRSEGRAMRIIGVVSDIRDQGPREVNVDTVYQDAGQLLTSSLMVLVRCHGACAPLIPTLRGAIREVDPNTPILSIRTFQTEMEGAFSSQQVLGFLSTLFAVLVMLLVGVGIYGVLSYSLTRRTREMGIRMALGASARDIARLFFSEAAMMIMLGTVIGVPCALGAVTALRSQLFGIEPHDPRALAWCMVCIALTIIVAAIRPIRRALSIGPQQALRIE